MRTLLVVALASAVLAGQGPATLAITNVTIVDGTGAAPRRGTVVVRDGVIAGIGAPEDVPSGATIVDGAGRFLTPGLWDMHVHLATRPEPRLAEQMILPLLLAHGIVGVRDMGGPLERVLDLRARIAAASVQGPRILTSGPFVDGPGETDPMFVRAPDAVAAATAARDLAALGVDFVKAQAGLQPDAHAALVRAARDAGTTVAGHIPLAMTAEAVIGSGQRTIEHISPALVGDGMLLIACSSKAAALLAELRALEQDRGTARAELIAAREAALRREIVETYDPARAQAIGRSMRDRDVWVVPTLIWSASLRPLDRADDGSALPMEYVPTALRARWTERRRQFIAAQTEESLAAARAVAAASARAVRDLHAAGAKVLAGTDTFDAFVLPGVSLHQELDLLVRAGLSPTAALQAATRNAAQARGAAEREGTVAAGKRADLLLLDADPGADIRNLARVHAVVVGGTLYNREALDRLLTQARGFASQ
jgi:imidazolonepropionase-like amidohydrolase